MKKYTAAGTLYCSSGEIQKVLTVEAESREEAKYNFAHTKFDLPEEGTLIIDYRSVKEVSAETSFDEWQDQIVDRWIQKNK